MHLQASFVALAFTAAAIVRVVVAARQYQVHINNRDDYCIFLPSTRETIGDSESDSQVQAFCTYPSNGQRSIPRNGWKNGPHFKDGGSYKQITGCINTGAFDTLVPDDEGGQYDDQTSPGLSCAGFASFVSLIEPAQGRVCIRCCNGSDCPTNHDMDGCLTVVPNGNYDGCN